MLRSKLFFIFTSLCFVFATVNLWAQNDIEISFTKFILKNGLTLIVHEDHKAPIVAVNVWYHVGSKNEKPGRTGFAHLFEHLMFNGSEHFNSDYFKVLERVGATDLNGTTNNDRTNYFQNVPTSAVDVALWMESDRMGYLLGAIDQARMDEQRGVVQNEKRQGENEPYGLTDELITKATYPEGHPYSWTVIGSMEDLSAASLQDVQEWFKTYYGAANAVLVVAGDIDPQTAKAKVEKYFGDIPSGPPVAKFKSWPAKRSGTQRQYMQDRVPQARIFKVWNVAEWGSSDATYLNLVSDILASGKTSRLYNRLVYKDQIATRVSAYLDDKEIAGQFYLDATAKAGIELMQIEKALDEELALFLEKGPTQKELDRVKTQYVAGFIRGVERIGGFGGKSDILASNEVYGGDPAFYKTIFKTVKEATVEQLWKAAKTWLSDGVYILEVEPFQKYETIKTDADRSKVPEAQTPPNALFPNLQRTTLSNGLKVILAERHSIPMVNFNLLIDAGYAADQFAKPGTAKLAMNMIDEGTAKRNALQISEELDMLGSYLASGAGLDMSTVTMNTLKMNLEKSLDIYSDVILNPSFPESDFTRLQKQQLAEIQQEKSSPMTMALRVIPALLYGSSHAYGNPLTGSGAESSVKAIARGDLVKYHQTWLKPNNATLVVVGDIQMVELKPLLDKYLKDWKSGEVPKKNISQVPAAGKSTLYLMDKPGAQQSVVIAAHIAPPKSDNDDIAMETMNLILGGTFTSRINMNIREEKHWSYGARSMIIGAKAQRTFLAYAPVQMDKTKESVQEIAKEFKGVLGAKPVTTDELNKVQTNRVQGLSGRWETMNAVAGSISDIVTYNLADTYYATYGDKVKAIKLADINTAAKKVLTPENNIWVVVGDRSKVEAGLKELGFEIKYLDNDGKVIL
jgi:zinc protease